MSGFTSGMMQGLNSVNNIWRTINNKEYQDEQLGLRKADQAMRSREYDLNDKFRRDNMAQQKQMHDDSLAMQKTINDQNVRLRELDQQIRRQQLEQSNQYRLFQEELEKNRQQQTQLQPLAAQAVQIIHDGGVLPDGMIEKLSVPGSPFNPALVTGKDYGSALNGLLSDVSGDPKKWNTPQNVERASAIFSPELNAMAGQVDPGNGKTIKSSVFSRFVPSPDGKFIAPEVKTEYTDGSSDTGPLTKFRSSHPDDPPIAIPVDKVSQQLWARKAYSYLLSNDPNVKAVANAGDKETRKAAAGKIADLEKERLKADAKFRSSALPDEKSQAALQKNIDDNDKQYQELEDRINSAYGLTNNGKSQEVSGNTGTVIDAVRQKIQADPEYAGFRDAMRGRQNPVDVDQLETQDLGELFQVFKENQEKNKQASTMAEQLRKNYQHQG